MKKYIVKYESLSGEVYYRQISGHSEQHALSQLSSVKSIYWIKTETQK